MKLLIVPAGLLINLIEARLVAGVVSVILLAPTLSKPSFAPFTSFESIS
jgi:hypothetical protein